MGNTLRLGEVGALLTTPSSTFGPPEWTISASGVGSQTQGGATLTAGGAPNHNGEIIFNANGIFNNSNISVDATIADNGSGTVSVVKAGSGAMKLRGHNTYSGGTYILQGRLQTAGSEDANGTANSDGLGSGPVYIWPGGQFYSSDISTIPNDFYISGTGIPTENSGAIRVRRGSISGKITLLGDAAISADGQTSASSTFSGQITDNGNGYALSFNTGLGTGIQLILANSSTNSNRWGGTTTVSNGSVVLLADEQLPDGPAAGDLTIASLGNLDLRGHTETINGLSGTGFVTNRASSTVGTMILGGGDHSGLFAGSFMNSFDGTGTVAVTKIGSGIQTLSGTSTHTGATTINGGILSVTGRLSASAMSVNNSATVAGTGTLGNITINSGGHTNPGAAGPNSIGTLGVSSFTANIGADMQVDLFGTQADNLRVTGAATLSGSVTVSPSGYPAAGQYLILGAPAAISGLQNATLNPFASLPHLRPTSAVLTNTANSLSIKITGGARNVTWTGSQNSTWDFDSPNWTDSISVGTETFYFGDTVTFPDLPDPAPRNISLVADVQPASVTVINGAGNAYTFGGYAIAGPGLLIKSGAGALIVANDNTYLGGTTINSGVLQIGNGGVNGSLGVGSILNLGTLVFDRRDVVRFDNVISGSGALVKNGSGAAILTASHAFSGVTIINDGTLTISGSLGSGSVVNNANLVFDRSGTTTFNNTISGTGNLYDIRSGTITLGAFNSYTGSTNVSAGTLIAAKNFTGGPLNISNAVAIVAEKGAPNETNGLTVVPTVNITGTGRLNLLNNAMIIDYPGGESPFASVRALLARGFNGGSWNGNGISSTEVHDANPRAAIAFAEASALSFSSFAGRSFDQSSLLLRFAYSGDANLDGPVNTLDFNVLASHFNSITQCWTDGDFNFDGLVNALDFNMLASNFGKTMGGQIGAAPLALASLVPEPAFVGIFGLGAFCCRRSRSSH
jgi:autotransporter-associated beta strand protein